MSSESESSFQARFSAKRIASRRKNPIIITVDSAAHQGTSIAIRVATICIELSVSIFPVHFLKLAGQKKKDTKTKGILCILRSVASSRSIVSGKQHRSSRERAAAHRRRDDARARYRNCHRIFIGRHAVFIWRELLIPARVGPAPRCMHTCSVALFSSDSDVILVSVCG